MEVNSSKCKKSMAVNLFVLSNT